MRRSRYGTTLLASILGAGGCRSSTPTQRPEDEPKAAEPTNAEGAADDVYSQQEWLHMTLCVAMGETVWIVNNAKQQGRSRESVLADFPEPEAELHRAIVEKVYGEDAGAPFDATVHALAECASDVVGEDRGGLGTFCLVQALTARIAWESRAVGQSYEQLMARTAAFPESLRMVLSEAYASQEDRVTLILGTWDRCMEAISAPSSEGA